jgi:hypothetical protein
MFVNPGNDTMAKNPSFPPPFGIPIPVDSDGPLMLALLKKLCQSKPQGFTLRLRTAQGNERRGGYLFHLRRDGEKWSILDYRSRVVWQFPTIPELLRFINHTSGRHFDLEMLKVCEEINRTMGEPGAEK